MEGKETVYVIGHKNPDTDSVCSAICYARLKEKITGQHYVAKRAGHLNEETQYVMDKLGVQPPEYMKDVRPQVRDIQIRKTPGVSKEISVNPDERAECRDTSGNKRKCAGRTDYDWRYSKIVFSGL